MQALLLMLVPLLPLIGFLYLGISRTRIGYTTASIVACGTVLIAFIISLFLFFTINFQDNTPLIISYFPFIHIGNINIDFSLQYDALSAVFLLIITGVGFLIHVYSTVYMHEEPTPQFAKYFSFLNLFVFSMLLLILGANFLILFIGWEGVGLCSYLLIGFWYAKTAYNEAANKAFIMNRVGDLSFLLAIFWLLLKLGTISFVAISPTMLSSTDVLGITLLLLLGATGKSAQIPLLSWLPDAMAGPTPVSALIHAATMVTAGVYMITRNHVLFSAAPFTMNLIACIGLLTAIYAAVLALVQNDIKKVLAYSTISQLGYMFLGLGVYSYTGAVFHVITHAFFKALLFLGAGSIILSLHHEQNIQNMGGLKKKLPITHICFLLACLAISGIPPFSGFFSKDEILNATYSFNPYYWVVGVIGAGLTAFYMFRLYMLVFSGSYRGNQEGIKEKGWVICLPLVLLAVLSTFGGWLNTPSILMGNERLAGFLYSVLGKKDSTVIDALHPINQEYMLMAISTIVAISSMILAMFIYSKPGQAIAKRDTWQKIVENKWGMKNFYQRTVQIPMTLLSFLLAQIIEKKFLEGMVRSVINASSFLSRKIRMMQNGQVNRYIIYMVLGIVLFLLFWFLDIRIYNSFV
ncbi:MAG: NADH-quinone oxidoreductase subunit L [Phycisphaerales bacterium]|nr:NADH-quinone oxidoreductase subunit L [Phycisphaerales bacterium]